MLKVSFGSALTIFTVTFMIIDY